VPTSPSHPLLSPGAFTAVTLTLTKTSIRVELDCDQVAEILQAHVAAQLPENMRGAKVEVSTPPEWCRGTLTIRATKTVES